VRLSLLPRGISRPFFTDLFRGAEYSSSYSSDSRRLFGVSAHAARTFSVAELLEEPRRIISRIDGTLHQKVEISEHERNSGSILWIRAGVALRTRQDGSLLDGVATHLQVKISCVIELASPIEGPVSEGNIPGPV
jgi:hypothetical protein